MRIIKGSVMIDVNYDNTQIFCRANSSKYKTRYVYCYDKRNRKQILVMVITDLREIQEIQG